MTIHFELSTVAHMPASDELQSLRVKLRAMDTQCERGGLWMDCFESHRPISVAFEEDTGTVHNVSITSDTELLDDIRASSVAGKPEEAVQSKTRTARPAVGGASVEALYARISSGDDEHLLDQYVLLSRDPLVDHYYNDGVENFPISVHTLVQICKRLRPDGETRVHVRPLTLNKFIWACVVRVSKPRGKDVVEWASRRDWRLRELEKACEALRRLCRASHGRGRDSGMGVLPLTDLPKRPEQISGLDVASPACCFAIYLGCHAAIAHLTIDVFTEIERHNGDMSSPAAQKQTSLPPVDTLISPSGQAVGKKTVLELLLCLLLTLREVLTGECHGNLPQLMRRAGQKTEKQTPFGRTFLNHPEDGCVHVATTVLLMLRAHCRLEGSPFEVVVRVVDSAVKILCHWSVATGGTCGSLHEHELVTFAALLSDLVSAEGLGLSLRSAVKDFAALAQVSLPQAESRWAARVSAATTARELEDILRQLSQSVRQEAKKSSVDIGRR